jgi:hypothetical protein
VPGIRLQYRLRFCRMIATAVEGTQNQVLAPEESNKSSASLWNANTLDMKAAMLGETHQPGLRSKCRRLSAERGIS